MAFSLKTWVNRISEYPNRRKLTHEDGSTELVTVARAEGQISAEGNAFSAEEMNDLENRIKGGFDEVTQSLTNINTYVGKDGNLHFVNSTGADTVIPFKSYNYDYYTGKSPFTKTFDKKPKSLVAICHTYATLVINGSIKYNQDNRINIDKNFSFYHNNCNGKEVYLVVFDYE